MTEWWDELHNDPRATQPLRKPRQFRGRAVLIAVCVVVAMTAFSIDVILTPIRHPTGQSHGN